MYKIRVISDKIFKVKWTLFSLTDEINVCVGSISLAISIKI